MTPLDVRAPLQATASNAGNGSGGRRPAHAQHVDEVIAAYHTHPTRGLTRAQARDLLERHGANRLPETPPAPWWSRFFRQFRDLVVLMLIAAAVVSAAVGDWLDAGAILAI